MILVVIFYEKNFTQAKKKTTRDIFILECEKDNKDGIFSFKVQAIKINKL